MAKAEVMRVCTVLALTALAVVLLGAVVPAQLTKAASPTTSGSIAFTSDRKAHGDGTLDVYRMSDNGRGPTKKLTDVPGNNVMPAWSNDGDEIAFVHYGQLGSYNIYRMAGDGSAETLLTNNLLLNVDPVWLPGGRKIAFSRGEDIYVMNLDASGYPAGTPTRLTTSGFADRQPSVSPGGDKIAFASNRDGDFDIYIMKLARESRTNTPIKITSNAKSDLAPDWSPRGGRITFAGGGEGDRDIFVMKALPQNATTNPVRNLTNNGADDFDPDWSSDARNIAFASDRTGDSEVWLMRADGSSARNLTESPNSQEFQPAWRPTP